MTEIAVIFYWLTSKKMNENFDLQKIDGKKSGKDFCYYQ